jgi:hypothetical protein
MLDKAAAKTAVNDDIGEETRLELYRSQVNIREAEQRAYDLFLQNLVKGTSHLSLGQEAVAAGFAGAMQQPSSRGSGTWPNKRAIVPVRLIITPWKTKSFAVIMPLSLPSLQRYGCAPLARWCDVFCDRGFFTPDESAAILEAGRRVGLKPRIHADELASSGGSAVAESVGARSADHLVHADAEGIAALARGGVVATLLPCAAFFLKLGRFAPARDLVAAGVPVALAPWYIPESPSGCKSRCRVLGATKIG